MPKQKTTENHTEYSVYIFPKDEKCLSMPKWKKAGATRNVRRALKHARLLKYKKKYHRIEVKKCFFCESEKRRVGKTIKIFDSESTQIRSLFDIFIRRKAG